MKYFQIKRILFMLLCVPLVFASEVQPQSWFDWIKSLIGASTVKLDTPEKKKAMQELTKSRIGLSAIIPLKIKKAVILDATKHQLTPYAATGMYKGLQKGYTEQSPHDSKRNILEDKKEEQKKEVDENSSNAIKAKILDIAHQAKNMLNASDVLTNSKKKNELLALTNQLYTQVGNYKFALIRESKAGKINIQQIAGIEVDAWEMLQILQKSDDQIKKEQEKQKSEESIIQKAMTGTLAVFVGMFTKSPEEKLKEYLQKIEDFFTQAVDLYAILGVYSDATFEEIKKAYRKKSLELHPDKKGNEDKFKELKKAYEILTNPSLRELYNVTSYENVIKHKSSMSLLEQEIERSEPEG